ncbi:MAG: hypothetical protein ACKVIP_03995 [bacterium]
MDTRPIKKTFLKTLLLLCCFIFSPAAWSQQLENSLRRTNLAPEILRAMIPEKQQTIMNALAEFASQYKASPNSVKKYLLRQKRQKFLAEQLKDLVVSDWIGRIQTLHTTENGKAYLLLELAILPPENTEHNLPIPEFRVTMGTWNNAYTDLDYKTLILPGTPLHTWLATFNEGEWLIFSGKSFVGNEDYLKEASPSETDAMLSPQFILKFELLDKLDIPEEELQIVESSTTPATAVTKETDNSKQLPAVKTKSSKNKKTKKTSVFLRPELTIRYYQEYRLSNYDWDYQKYIERWHQLVRYHWGNHPASDYLNGSYPEGGEVFVLATVRRNGIVSNYQVSSLGEVSDKMREAALEATRLVALPPLPEQFPDDVLKVEFRFAHSRIQHLIKADVDQMKAVLMLQDNKTDAGNNIVTRMGQKLIRKQRLKQARVSFLEELRQEFSSHFNPHQRFDPSLELQIELGISRSGKVVEQDLTLPGKSVKFQLAVLNGLNQARFDTLPKVLRSESPYRVRLRVIP